VAAYAAQLLDDRIFDDAQEQAEALTAFLPEHLAVDDVAPVVTALLAAKTTVPVPVLVPVPVPVPPVPVPAQATLPVRASSKTASRFRPASRADLGLDDEDGGDEDDAGAVPAAARAVPDTRPVCRHYLAGGCWRADCAFAHDVTGTVCRFWLQGRCARGDACVFRHGPPQMEGAANAATEDDEEEEEEEEPRLDDGTAFPALGDTPRTRPAAPLPYALVGRVARLSAQYPQVPVTVVRDLLLAADGDAAAAARQLEQSAARFPAVPPPLPTSTRAAASATPYASSSVSSSPTASARAYLRGSVAPHPSLWVETGAAVSAQYQRTRGEAAQHAEQRNQLLAAAAAAYQRGDGAAAKALSRRGRWHHERMQELHARMR
jgi:hypothetical protein